MDARTDPQGGARSARPLESLRLIADDAMLLVRQELALARQEFDLKLAQATSGLVLAVCGILAAFVALAVLVLAVVAGLAERMDAWLAAALVGGVLAIAAAIMIAAARRRLSPASLTPRRTIESLNRAASTMKEKMS